MDQNIVILIQATLMAIPVLYMLRVNRKKTENENKSLEDTITDRVLERANTELTRLEDRLNDVEGEFDNLLRGAWTLHQQLLDNHIEPRYVPPRRLKDDPDRPTTKVEKPKKPQLGQPR
jgi:hypothetical protein